MNPIIWILAYLFAIVIVLFFGRFLRDCDRELSKSINEETSVQKINNAITYK